MGEVENYNPIPGYEGIYEISNLQNVRSLSRFIDRVNCGFWSKDKTLKPSFNKDNGYYSVCLYLNKKGKTFEIHKLMAMAFLGHTPCGMKLVVDHKNQIRTDNRLENLHVIPQRVNADQKHLKSTSEYVGVSFNNKSNKWHSSIRINGEGNYLGSFDTEKEASEYYEDALKNHLLGIEIKIKKHNFSSIYEGVSWHKKNNKWTAQIIIDKKLKYLGSFKTEIEAHNVRQNALKLLGK